MMEDPGDWMNFGKMDMDIDTFRTDGFDFSQISDEG